LKERFYRLNIGWETIVLLLVLAFVLTSSGSRTSKNSWEKICGCSQQVPKDAPVLSLPVNPKDIRYRYYGIWPFGIKGGGHPEGHPGIDFELKTRAEILAVASGTVIRIGSNPQWPNEYTLQIKYTSQSGNVYTFWYDHLGEVFVKMGDKVQRGEIIGRASIRHDKGPRSMIHFGLIVLSYEKIAKEFPSIRVRKTVCPGPYFSGEAKEILIKIVLRSKYHKLCYMQAL